MNAIVRNEMALYLRIQPGDGTIYTAMVCSYPDNDPDNMYLAIGAGDNIDGGYFMRRSSLIKLARRLLAIDNDQEMTSFLKNDHYINYWLSHYKGYDWTGIVGVLAGMVMALSSNNLNTSLKIIGGIYHSEHDLVRGNLVYWLARHDNKVGKE